MTMKTTVSSALLLSLASLALAPSSADAQRRRRPLPAPVVEEAPEPPPPEPSEGDIRARQHFEAGRSYFEASRYADAAREFMESYALSRRGELLINVASSHERNLDHAAAIEALETMRRDHPEVMDAAEIERRLEYLRRAEAARVAAEEAAARAAAAPPDVAEDPTLMILGATLAAAGGATLVAAAAMGGVAVSSMADFDGATRVSDRLRLRDQVREQSLVADVLFIAGGALAAGGIAVLVIAALDGGEPEASEPARASLRVEPWLGPDRWGASLRATF